MAMFARDADAQSDIDRIPAPSASSNPISTGGGPNLYLQGDLTLSARRDDLAVPLPPPLSPRWETRVFLDARFTAQLASNVDFSYSGRLNLRAEEGLPFPDHEDVRHDFREAYLSVDAGGLFFQLGRINLKSGVAFGFNPTDFFKTRAVVEPITADPTVLREDRLGTAMLLVQKVWTGASVTVALAPKFEDETAPHLNNALPSFDPGFDRTNARFRALAKLSLDLPDDLSPELLVYKEGDQTRAGFNLTRGIGKAVVAYVEWSGGDRTSLADESFVSGRRTGVLPPASVIPVSGTRFFANDLAAGASYTTTFGLTLNVEYDYHQAGFSGADWRNWFAAGAAKLANPLALGEFWFIRGYAADQQEPMARNSVFLLADWPHAFVNDLSLGGFVDGDLRDGSGLAQVTADYHLSPQWTVGALVDANFGGRHSDLGSLPQNASMLVKLTRYF